MKHPYLPWRARRYRHITLVEIGSEWREAEDVLDFHCLENADLILRRGEHVGLVFLLPAIDKLGLTLWTQDHEGRRALDIDYVAVQRGEISDVLLVISVAVLKFLACTLRKI